jgi:hypothetical protein
MKGFARIRSLSGRIIAAGMLAVAASTALATVEDKSPARVQVTWAPAEQLTEVKDNPIRRGWMRTEEWQKSLSDRLRKRADGLLPAGQRLEVSIDDLHLAGSFEPWRRTSLDEARILKDIYPPWMNLHYKLIASDGSTIRESAAKLRDSAYLQRAVPFNESDPLRYDKRMIDEWLWREFGRAKPAT